MKEGVKQYDANTSNWGKEIVVDDYEASDLSKDNTETCTTITKRQGVGKNGSDAEQAKCS